MDARLDDRIATALRRQACLDRGEDLLVGDLELFDVEAIEISDVDRRHGEAPEKTAPEYVYTLRGPLRLSMHTAWGDLCGRNGCD